MGYNKFAEDVFSISRLENGRLGLYINRIDFEITIANNLGEIYSVNQDSLEEFKSEVEPIKLDPRRRYYFRYNNNNGGIGILDVEVRLFDQFGQYEIVWERKEYAIQGPIVIEDKILFHEEGNLIERLKSRHRG